MNPKTSAGTTFSPFPPGRATASTDSAGCAGKTGMLACDAKSRVRLRNGKRYTLSYVGDLMEQAGLLANPDGVPAASPELPPALEDELLTLRSERDTLETQVNGLREELSAASETISRGRRLNGHLIALVRKQDEEAARPEKHRAKNPRDAAARNMTDAPNSDETVW